MTPLWLETHASYLDRSSVITANQITFNAGSTDQGLLLRIPLVKAGILKDGTPLTVEITVAKTSVLVKVLTVILLMACRTEPVSSEFKQQTKVIIAAITISRHVWGDLHRQRRCWQDIPFSSCEILPWSICLHLQGREVLGFVLHCSRWRLHQDGKL